MTEDARSRLRAAPYGYTTGLVPGVAEAAAALRDALWDPAGAVSARLKELVFLRTSVVNQCET
jgi:alkylhydroperoxidase family enzyme